MVLKSEACEIPSPGAKFKQEAKMQKIIKIFSVGLVILTLTGCTMSAKSFVKKTEPKFNEIVNQGSAMSDIINKSSVTASTKITTIADVQTKISAARNELATLKPNKSAQGLDNNLSQYYKEMALILTDLGNMIDFADISAKFAQDFESSIKSMPSDFSQDLTATRKQFVDAKNNQEKILSSLKGKSVSTSYEKAKSALETMVSAYIDYLNSAIAAIDAKNASLIKYDDFKNKLEKANTDFQSQMDTIQKDVFGAARVDPVSKLEDTIKTEFNTLR